MSDIEGDSIYNAVQWNPKLSFGNSAVISGRIDTLYDYDLFEVYLEQGHVYNFGVGIKNDGLDYGDTKLRLLDSSGSWISPLTSVVAGEYRNKGWEAPISGKYYLEINASFSGNTGGYDLSLEQISNNPIKPDDFSSNEYTTGFIPVGESIRGEIERGGDIDVFRLKLPYIGATENDSWKGTNNSETFIIRMYGETIDEYEFRLGETPNSQLGGYEDKTIPYAEKEYLEILYKPIKYQSDVEFYYLRVKGKGDLNIGQYSITLSDSNNKARIRYSVGQNYTFEKIKDFGGNFHGLLHVEDSIKSAYKYQGLLDVNGDGVKEDIFTNMRSKRWATLKPNNETWAINFDDNGAFGGTRVVGIYIDPLVTSGEVEQFGPHDSQRRFQNDLKIDNLIAKTSGDYDGDGFQEVYWKTNDGTAYLRALMHADGNIQYANYQSEEQMNKYLTANGFSSILSEITS